MKLVGILVVLGLAGAAVFIGVMQERFRPRRTLARLEETDDAQRARVLAEAENQMDRALVEDGERLDPSALRAATFMRLRTEAERNKLPISDEGLWEAVDRALAHDFKRRDDGVLAEAAARELVELRTGLPHGADLSGLREEIFGRLRKLATSRNSVVDDGVLYALVDETMADADFVTREGAQPAVAKAISKRDGADGKAVSSNDLDAALSGHLDKDLILLRAEGDGRFTTLGESFDSADAAGRYLTRELVTLYFPEGLQDESEAAGEATQDPVAPKGETVARKSVGRTVAAAIPSGPASSPAAATPDRIPEQAPRDAGAGGGHRPFRRLIPVIGLMHVSASQICLGPWLVSLAPPTRIALFP